MKSFEAFPLITDCWQMELKMKAICEGRKSRREVIDETINQYRTVYVRTQQRLNVMKEVNIRLPFY
jgi:DNA topoisomerase IA